MAIDLSKLKLPWRADDARLLDTEDAIVATCWMNPRVMLPENMQCYCDRAEAIALAFQALDVMMRRGWSASIDLQSGDPRQWYAVDEYAVGVNCSLVSGTKSYPLHIDPFTAIVEADRWYKENVEAKNGA